MINQLNNENYEQSEHYVQATLLPHSHTQQQSVPPIDMPFAPPQPVKKSLFRKWWVWVIAVVVALGIIGPLASGFAKVPDNTSLNTNTPAGTSQQAVAENTDSPAVVEQPASPEQVAPATPTETVSQSSAVRQAESYIKVMSFSRQGLIEQLEYEGYSYEDSVYAVDTIKVDWNEQAKKTAKSYLNTMSFSRQGLIEQLEFEGFTYEQAVYGVDSNNVDWNEQARKTAKSYLDLMPFSRQGLIDQLVFEGFTYEQAVVGVDSVGL